ncbi:MAG TPA: hypothetical protein VLF91_03435 [Candidatus Saccharimonadales bacterium]|nr:hypothetical protein [Candidatus Saccharimonadales bacterium]
MKPLQVIGIVSGVLAALAYLPYLRDILRGDAKPERASWFIWVVLAGIAFFTQMASGATSSLWFTGLDSAGALVVFVLALKYGSGGLTRRDQLGLLAAGVGLLLWYLTRHATIALFMTIIVDASGTVLTVLKTYEHPKTETYTMWLVVTIAGALAMFSVGSWNLSLLAYPFYIFLANLAVVLAKFVGSRKR